MAWILIHEARKTVYYGPFAFYTEAMDFRNKKRSLYANDGLEIELRIEATIEIAAVDNMSQGSEFSRGYNHAMNTKAQSQQSAPLVGRDAGQPTQAELVALESAKRYAAARHARKHPTATDLEAMDRLDALERDRLNREGGRYNDPRNQPSAADIKTANIKRERQALIDAAAEDAINGSPDAFQG